MIRGDITASNGVIHVIDSVILPDASKSSFDVMKQPRVSEPRTGAYGAPKRGRTQ